LREAARSGQPLGAKPPVQQEREGKAVVHAHV
jgi:hypothetical protein